MMSPDLRHQFVLFVPQNLQFLEGRLIRFVVASQVVFEAGGLVCRGTGRGGLRITSIRRRGVLCVQGRDFQRRQLLVEDQQLIDRPILEADITKASTESQFDAAGIRVTPFRAVLDVARQFVADHVQFGGDSVLIDVQTRRATAAIVRDGDLCPFADGDRLFADDLDRVARPEVDQRDDRQAVVEHQ